MSEERWQALTKTLVVVCDRMKEDGAAVARAIVTNKVGTKALILVAIGNEAVAEVAEVTHTLVDSPAENLTDAIAKA